MMKKNVEKEELIVMKNLWNRAKYVLKGEDGASNIEIIVWISVVLVIATALFMFRDSIKNFLGKAKGQVDNLQVQ
jgi:Flp pilus assembly pilin Flp